MYHLCNFHIYLISASSYLVGINVAAPKGRLPQSKCCSSEGKCNNPDTRCLLAKTQECGWEKQQRTEQEVVGFINGFLAGGERFPGGILWPDLGLQLLLSLFFFLVGQSLATCLSRG